MSYYDDPNREWRNSAEENAAKAARWALVNNVVRQGFLAIAPSLIGIAASVFVVYFAVRALQGFQGWARWLTLVYLLALLVSAVAEAVLFIRSQRKTVP